MSVKTAESVGDLAGRADFTFLAHPGKDEVRRVCLGKQSLLERCATGPRRWLECSTAPAALAPGLGVYSPRWAGLGAPLFGGRAAREPMERTVTLRYGDAYWPAVIEAADATDEPSSSD